MTYTFATQFTSGSLKEMVRNNGGSKENAKIGKGKTKDIPPEAHNPNNDW
ncbi:hypothetical protein LI140_03025 [Phocaeicola dorei]|nr:hypothetical protein [Phocaeicola dorei]MBV4238631.1 hypothetical protein [Phocaeicola dorei]MCB6461208.1 hypothetical protein [Phocaeicola dorei]MCB6746598.1 hypothetical protein [Phocaeicola dorei]MCB6771991.1 hypothetical protein [Phocaeicola dorei]MCB6790798.1 hypothetical protein [Phocaeicola dorei]